MLISTLLSLLFSGFMIEDSEDRVEDKVDGRVGGYYYSVDCGYYYCYCY